MTRTLINGTLIKYDFARVNQEFCRTPGLKQSRHHCIHKTKQFMKTKNLIMAALAFTFAIGGAFASMFSDEDVYVKAKTSAAGSPKCIKTTGRCDDTGANLCQILVPVSHGTSPVAANTTASGTSFKTFRGTACTIAIHDTGGEVQNVTPEETIYELLP